MRADRLTVDALDDVLNHHSGLAGISGLSSDMRDLMAAMASKNPRAQLAFDIFVHRLRSAIAAMSASLGRLDVLVFSAGIGENAAAVRRAACAGLSFLGIQLDEARNSAAKADGEISSPASSVRVFVVHAQEEWAIALECARLLPHQ
jgi:acetate kinase